MLDLDKKLDADTRTFAIQEICGYAVHDGVAIDSWDSEVEASLDTLREIIIHAIEAGKRDARIRGRQEVQYSIKSALGIN